MVPLAFFDGSCEKGEGAGGEGSAYLLIGVALVSLEAIASDLW
jgi:hypothetical protein